MTNQSHVEMEAVKFRQESQSRPPPQVEMWPRTRTEFAAMVEAYQDRLVRYALRRLGRRAEAEDVVQDVFVRAYARLGDSEAVTRVSSYLYRMAANACTDTLRKRRRAPVTLHREQAERIPDPRKGVGDEAAAFDELRRVEAVLARLPKRQAEVVRLRILDDLRFVEIAEVLGCSVGTVKSRLRYGLQKLRAIVGNDWEERS
jgi:RNA polymerase sigma-70 factor, ECF subfamily